MNKQRLIVCIMGQNCERFIKMCLESVKDADEIVYIDGGSTDRTSDIICENGFVITGGKTDITFTNNKSEEIKKVIWIENKYEQEDKTMNGKQRNYYLKYLKENYPNEWCLCLDADEILDECGISKIKKFLEDDKTKPIFNVYDIHMRHFIGDLGHEDATNSMHWVPRRLFKITEDLIYPEVEHPVLMSKDNKSFDHYHIGRCAETTLWHMAYSPNMWEIKKRYENHLKKSNMHTPEFLKNWYYAHLLGKYPKKEFDIRDIPKVIYDEFGIDKDEFYFMERNLEIKHPIMVKQWYEYFKPESVLDLGAGKGCYLMFWKWYTAFSYGIELSNWAVNHAFCNDIKQGNIVDSKNYDNYDLITAIDVLEHLTDDELDKTLSNMSKYGKRFLFSIPFDGDPDKDIPADPNLYNDKTHKIFKTKEEWIKLIESYGIRIKDPPQFWSYAPQILIGEKA